MSYVVIRRDDCEDHVYSTTQPSLKEAMKFVSFCRKDNDPMGTYIIAKIVAVKRRPRRWRLS
jgi:hypothetical protein